MSSLTSYVSYSRLVDAISTLRNLAVAEAHKEKIIKEGIVQKIEALLNTQDLDMAIMNELTACIAVLGLCGAFCGNRISMSPPGLSSRVLTKIQCLRCGKKCLSPTAEETATFNEFREY